MALVPDHAILSTDPIGRVAPPISAPVGRGGTNDPLDVFVIQQLLDRRLPEPHLPLLATGTLDPGTVLAIQAYQAVILNMIAPTGLVEPGSPTYYSLAAHPLVAEQTTKTVGHYGKVPPEIVEAAVASQQHWHIPASITLAQWVVESAWGAAVPPGSNNPFGMKASGDQPFVESLTQEVRDGAIDTETAKFRKFASIADAFDQHGKYLANSPRYEAARSKENDPDAFADALTGVYATDPKYGFTLKWVIHNYGFTNYDH